MSLVGIRQAIATALGTISGLRVHQTAPESIGQLPAAYIVPRSGSYDLAAGGQMIHRFEVVLLVQRGGSLSEAQDALDDYLSASGSSSVRQAINSANLGAHADCIRVEGYRDYGGLEYAGQLFLGARLDVEVVV